MNFPTCKVTRKARAIGSGQMLFNGSTPGKAYLYHAKSSCEILTHKWIGPNQLAVVSDFQDEVPCSSTEPIRAAFHRIADVPQIKVTVSCAVLLGDITWLSAAEFLERTKGEFSFHIECGYVGGIVETNSVMIENFEGVTEIEDPGTHWHRAARSVDFCEALCRISDCELRDIYSAIEEENIPGVIQTIDTPTCMHLAGNIYGLEINDSGMTMVNFTHTQAEVVFAQYQPPQISRQYSG